MLHKWFGNFFVIGQVWGYVAVAIVRWWNGLVAKKNRNCMVTAAHTMDWSEWEGKSGATSVVQGHKVVGTDSATVHITRTNDGLTKVANNREQLYQPSRYKNLIVVRVLRPDRRKIGFIRYFKYSASLIVSPLFQNVLCLSLADNHHMIVFCISFLLFRSGGFARLSCMY